MNSYTNGWLDAGLNLNGINLRSDQLKIVEMN